MADRGTSDGLDKATLLVVKQPLIILCLNRPLMSVGNWVSTSPRSL